MVLVREVDARGSCDAVERSLLRAGLPDGPDDCCLIVLVDTVDSSTFRSVESLACSGNRTLVVSTDERHVDAVACWTLLRVGATDVISWAGEHTARDVIARVQRWREIDRLVASPAVRDRMVGNSAALIGALRELVEVSVFSRAPVLVTGDTGTGKELAAQIVHALDTRSPTGSLVVVDCTTIVPTLSGSELFGHERGAFTGAASMRTGALAAANRGTLFLDEIGELPTTLQAELLRSVQEGTYKRVGSDAWQRTSFRLVAATNRDLDAEQSAGRFRKDLFHRLASGVIRLPSLHQRREDIEPLFSHFLRGAMGRDPPELDGSVREMLLARAYPGNVRELRQLAIRVASRHVGKGPISPGDVPPADRPPPAVDRPHPATDQSRPGAWLHPASVVPNPLTETLRALLSEGLSLKEVQKRVGDAAVDLVVTETNGNLQAAARRLGVTDRALQLRRAGVDAKADQESALGADDPAGAA